MTVYSEVNTEREREREREREERERERVDKENLSWGHGEDRKS